MLKKCFLVFCAAALFLTGCGKASQKQKAKYRIGVSIPAATHGWSAGVIWHAEQVRDQLQKENPDAEILITTCTDAADQVNRIENLMTRGVNALVVMAQEPDPLQTACVKAKKKGIYLVIVSNPLKERIEDVFVNGDNTGFGVAAAHAMGKELQGKGNIVVMEGYSSPINTARITAFRNTLQKDYPGIKILDSRLAYYSSEKALALMENYLQKFKNTKIDGVWAGDDDALLGALKACTEQKATGIRTIIGGGGSSKVVKMIMDGHPQVRTTVTYPPQIIVTGIKAALTGLQGKQQAKELTVPSEIVTKENASGYYFPASNY
jgi:ribose transport system substrate-binding protein